MSWTVYFLLSCVAGLFVIEGFIPHKGGQGNRYTHAAINIGLGLTNELMRRGFVPLVVFWASAMPQKGLFSYGRFPPAAAFLVTIFIFDAWMYAWHRANHTIPFLWRFHRVHHTDLAMDVTTASRFHPVEILFSNILVVIVTAFLGLEALPLMVYHAIFVPVINFQHSNVAFPEKWDRLLRRVIVTPNMHRVHHSKLRMETDSNYASVFSFWDRLFGSYREKKDTKLIIYGIGAYEKPRWQRFDGLLALPFKK